MRVVDLADEFGATTAETLDLCERAGVAAVDGGHELTEAEAEAVRRLYTQGVSTAAAEPPPGPLGPATDAPVPFASGFAGGPAGPTSTAPSDRGRGGSGPGSHTAVFGVTASLLGLCLPIIPAVIGIVLGTIAKRQAKAGGSSAKVSGPATAAQVLGVIFLVGWGAFFAIGFVGSRTSVTVGDAQVTARRTPFAEVTDTDCIVLQKTAVVEDLLVVPCSEMHDAQVVGSVPVGYTPSATEDEDALAACQALAASAGASGQLVVGALIPSAPSRTVAHSKATCILHYADNHAYIGRI